MTDDESITLGEATAMQQVLLNIYADGFKSGKRRGYLHALVLVAVLAGIANVVLAVVK